MPKKSKPSIRRHRKPPGSDGRQVIRLSCSYSGAPGISWIAVFEARSFSNRIEIWETDADEQLKLTNTLPPGDIYERLTQSLESLDANCCLFPGALSEIVVEGESGYRADLLSLCWCRWGEEKEINYCRDFLSLSKSAIQKLIGYYGSLVINSSQEKSFLRDFDELKELQQLLNCDEVPLWPAPGFEDTELGVFTEPEVSHGETEVHPRVQA